MITWVLFLGIGLVIGVVAGLYFARLDDVTNSQKKALQQKLDKAESQMNAYKSQVSEHFLKTATLVNSMTESYKAVHEHLALGARDLCDAEVSVEQLEMPDSKLIDVTSTAVKEQETAEAAPAEVESPQAQVEPTESEAVKANVDEQPGEQQPRGAEAEQSADTQVMAEENAPIEPPSTPESLHVDEESSATSSISDVEQSQTNASRMVH